MTAGDEGIDASAAACDVVVVGGGPAGCSAGIFTARYGLETTIFDRGKAALRRSAFLANYPGIPAGIDIDTFYDLLHDHAREAGCTLVDETVVSVERLAATGAEAGEAENSASPPPFVVETSSGRTVTTDHVIAAAWYDGEYLRPLVGEDAFEEHEHHGEVEDRFDPEYPDADGRTPVEGLYVAAPSGHRNEQAVISAGNGAHVARSLIKDHRRARGFPAGVLARYFDWLRPDSEFSGEWAERERWREWFDNETPADTETDPDRLAALREEYIDRAFETKVPPEAVDRRTERAQRRLLDHLDDAVVLEYARNLRADGSDEPEAGDGPGDADEPEDGDRPGDADEVEAGKCPGENSETRDAADTDGTKRETNSGGTGRATDTDGTGRVTDQHTE